MMGREHRLPQVLATGEERTIPLPGLADGRYQLLIERPEGPVSLPLIKYGH